jgi:hypothetical protein
VEIGGPGSTERSILRGLKRDPFLAQPSSIYDIDLPLDHLWDVAAGTFVGSGIDDIVDEVKVAVLGMVNAGVSSVDLVGFSRGAVSLALALQRIGEELGPTFRTPVPINVCLLDPVPGPYLVPKHVEIPSFVNRLLLFVSKHEGRWGFLNLGLSVSPEVTFRSDLVMGVHGDIGGSTRSAMTILVKDEVAEFLGLPSFRLSLEERVRKTLEIMANPSPYTHPGIMQMWERRALGWSGHEGDPDVIELPSARAMEDLQKYRFPDEEEEAEPLGQHDELEWSAKKWLTNASWPRVMKPFKRMQPVSTPFYRAIVPPRPVRNPVNRIVVPPARIVAAPSECVKAVKRFIRMLPK